MKKLNKKKKSFGFCLPPIGGDERKLFHIEKFFNENFQDTNMFLLHI